MKKDFIPRKPFPNYKWKWASVQCTEGLNDPVVLLGVLFRMYKLESSGVKYSSPEFTRELVELSDDLSDSVNIDLAGRTGNRNLIRNSGQYWRAVNLIDAKDYSGKIHLTDFGRRVARHEVSQAEFAAITVRTFRLPNSRIQSKEELKQWQDAHLLISPLRLILQIVCRINEVDSEQAYITPDELAKIVVPLAGAKAELEDFVRFILWHRQGEISLEGWSDCTEGANDYRIVRENLLFLHYYGYLNKSDVTYRNHEKYELNVDVIDEIKEIISVESEKFSFTDSVEKTELDDVASEMERKRVRSAIGRPNQARFRKEVLQACKRCVITNVKMPEILEAAHIKPYKYNGEDTIANGFAMRVDIHTLFDSGHLRISPNGVIELSSRARMDYGASIPPSIVLPKFTNREYLRWRWENYNGL